MKICRAGISYLGSNLTQNENNQNENLKFIDDVLTVEFEEKLYSEDSKPENYIFTHLEYNRKTPEKSFIIKTEKRAESSVK